MYALSQNDRRAWRRFDVPMAGKLFGPTGRAHACEVLELSPGGARVQARHDLPTGEVALYLDRVGRIAAKTVSATDAVLTLQFQCGEDHRHLISQLLGRMVQAGQAYPSRLRRQHRISISGFPLVLADGPSLDCDVLDLSARGALLRVAARPPLGELVTIGDFQGRVCRHHADGIAVEFLRAPRAEAVSIPAAYRPPLPA